VAKEIAPEKHMEIDPRILEALKCLDPVNELRSLVRSLQAQGKDQRAILELFERARQQLRESGREKEEDVVMEIMDFLIGWCSPHVSLTDKNRR
jgi:hypothetical protein